MEAIKVSLYWPRPPVDLGRAAAALGRGKCRGYLALYRDLANVFAWPGHSAVCLAAELPWLRVLDETEATSVVLRDVVRRYQVRGKHIHDANIVATMLSHGVSRLATYNRQDFDFREVKLEPIP